MSEFVIMTDSSCDLPAPIAEQMELTVLPLYVDVDGQKYTNYLDEREISFAEIYAKLRTKRFYIRTKANFFTRFNVSACNSFDGFEVVQVCFLWDFFRLLFWRNVVL